MSRNKEAMMVVTKESLADLEKLYNHAVKVGDATLTFQGNVLLTSYTKYLIEYTKSKLKC